jgi:hypothetical protein
MPKRVRTTISLTPEAHAIFKRMADAANMSLARCMGDWLADTSEAALLITVKIEEARKVDSVKQHDRVNDNHLGRLAG